LTPTDEPKAQEKQVVSEENSSTDDTVSPDTELWDDGMKVPDWLKTDNDKND
jgi:hypothetical protein